MSFEATQWGWAVRGLSAAQRLVLLRLADHADTAGLSWPSIKVLIHHTELSERTVRDALRSLEDAGHIKTEHRTNERGLPISNRYRLAIPLSSYGAKSAPPVTGAVGARNTEGANAAQDGADFSQDGADFAPPLESLIESSKESSRSFAGGSSPPPRTDQRQGIPKPVAPVQGSRPAAQGSLLPAEIMLSPSAKTTRRPKTQNELSATALTWAAYAKAYEGRYETTPEKNGEVMGKLSMLVARVGHAQAPILASYYLTRNDARYSYHPVGLLLTDYQKLMTAMKTGRVVTETTARANERTATTGDAWDARIRQRQREEQEGVIDVECKAE